MLTAKELGIRQWELDSLVVVADKLKSGGIQPKNFDMHMCIEEGEECGTVCCIGGWVGYISDYCKTSSEINYYVSCTKDKIKSLYYPPNYFDWRDITVGIATKAIDNFLGTGNPQWDSFGLVKMFDSDEDCDDDFFDFSNRE